jgi:hypothetical protein
MPAPREPCSPAACAPAAARLVPAAITHAINIFFMVASKSVTSLEPFDAVSFAGPSSATGGARRALTL